VIWGDGAVVTTKVQAEAAITLEIEFQDGRLAPRPTAKKTKPTAPNPPQGSLF
jgi:exodeoxyribonuclease VII large subunit